MSAGRTLGDVAAAIGWPTADTLRLLEELEAKGIAHFNGAGWVLTETAEARYGQAFRDLRLDDEEGP